MGLSSADIQRLREGVIDYETFGRRVVARLLEDAAEAARTGEALESYPGKLDLRVRIGGEGGLETKTVYICEDNTCTKVYEK